MIFGFRIMLHDEVLYGLFVKPENLHFDKHLGEAEIRKLEIAAT